MTLRAHPPERGPRRLDATAYAGCCCCCCCCLHSAGSLVGAAVGTLDRRPPVDEKGPSLLADDEIDGPGAGAQATAPVRSFYWAATIVATISVAWIAGLIGGPEGALWVPAFAMPLIQLGASLLTALLLTASPAARRDPRAWRRLKRITVGSVLGCLVGISLLILGFIICSARS